MDGLFEVFNLFDRDELYGDQQHFGPGAFPPPSDLRSVHAGRAAAAGAASRPA